MILRDYKERMNINLNQFFELYKFQIQKIRDLFELKARFYPI